MDAFAENQEPEAAAAAAGEEAGAPGIETEMAVAAVALVYDDMKGGNEKEGEEEGEEEGEGTPRKPMLPFKFDMPSNPCLTREAPQPGKGCDVM